MVSRSLPRRAGRRILTGLAVLLRDERGGALIEFALVAPLFIGLIVAILNTALVFLAQQSLETVAENSARLIMTGNAQTSVIPSGGNTHTGMTQSDFINAVCTTIKSGITPLLTCDPARLFIDVTTVNKFSDANTGAATLSYNGSKQLTTTQSSFSYTPGTQGAIVVLRVMYLWPTGNGPLGFTMTNQNNNNRLLVATSVLKTEGY